jgi:hypothetical protein
MASRSDSTVSAPTFRAAPAHHMPQRGCRMTGRSHPVGLKRRAPGGQGHFFGRKSWWRHRADLGGAEIQELLRGSRPEALAGRGEQDRAEAVVKSARGDPKFREDELITCPERCPLHSEGEHGAFLASHPVLQFHAARKTSCSAAGGRADVAAVSRRCAPLYGGAVSLGKYGWCLPLVGAMGRRR